MSIRYSYIPHAYVYYSYGGQSYYDVIYDLDYTQKLDREVRVKPNPLTKTERLGRNKFFEKKGLYKITYYDTGMVYQSPFSGFTPAVSFEKAWQGELLNQINSEFINLSLYVLELRQTISFAADFGEALVKIFTSVTNPVKFAKSISGAWLSYVYGFAPTVADINKAALGMHDVISGTPITFSDKFFERFSEKSKSGYYETVVESIRHSRYSISCMLQPPGITYYGGPISSLWEMVPYSFVFDWFIPVSDFLTQCDTHRLIQSAYGFRSEKTDYVAKTRFLNYAGDFYTMRGTKAYEYQSKVLSRYVINNIPSPQLPRYQPHLGTQRLLNSAALLTQLLKTRR